MNRKERRAAVARTKTTASSTSATIADLTAEATLAYQQGQSAQAEVICKQILARAPEHTASMNLLAVIYQASDRHRLAVKLLADAIALDELDPACHYNIGLSYQVLHQRTHAAAHFKKAIALGLSGRNVEQFLMKDPVVIESIQRITENEGVGGY